LFVSMGGYCWWMGYAVRMTFGFFVLIKAFCSDKQKLLTFLFLERCCGT